MAVLVENNYDYVRSRASLLDLNARSWHRRLVSLFIPRYKGRPTGCAELDHEIDTVRNGIPRKEQLASDALLAQTINEEQYRTVDALFECQCCFGEFPWEEICFCSDLHSFCRECLQRSVEGSLYGQGSSFDYIRASIKCISSIADPACMASISPPLLPHFLSPRVFSSLEDHLVKRALDMSGVRSLRCPFCSYAVVDGDDVVFKVVEDDHDREMNRGQPEGDLPSLTAMISAIPRILSGIFTAYITPTYTNLWAWLGSPIVKTGEREGQRVSNSRSV